ncbi:histidinol-phosphatase (PHP family) [Sporomusaceae bacterium BoRhaA]|uniref:histidinol phosphate phosphatase n=1 Tax=Pelorhabdus rhamnosifermentans TaxID=2772457 RepID=UPI001C060D53|nr:histidinol phosphate phosphatase [Pelorhabdus rhamnosifermentans]MBU2702472.1 histidinol-phosphatase (PHP family) [Pelorhabdus rhamnosifermentans]
MLFDTHLHTCFSTDSEMTLDELKKEMSQQNYGAIITEHMDLHYPVSGKFTFSIDDYFSLYGPYRNKALLLGIEIGLRQDSLAEYNQVVRESPFDFVLGSIHVVDQHDLFYPPYYEGRSKQEAYERYFRTMIDCVKAYDFVDSLGHIDYIARYAPYADPEIYYHDFSDVIQELLTVVVQKDIALEINTRRFDDRQVMEHLLPIYQKFHDLGGKYVTLGSDAHRPTAVANHLQDAWQLAQRCSLQAVYYQGRQRMMLTE